MRNIIKYFIVGLVSVPFFALATPVSWDFTSSVLRPLSSMWTNEVKVPYLTATSTTNNNTLPLLVNTTGTSTNFAVTTRLNLFGTIGTALTDFCVAITGGSGLCDGTDSDTTYTAGDALTLTGNDIDFDGGATPSGDLGGTWASPSVSDDSHAHTGTTISGLDISSDTNLSADGTEIVLTDDALSLGTNLTFTNSTSSNLTVTTGTNLFGGGYVTTANALCQQLTGSAALCDGSDATGGSGSSISTSTTPNIGEVAYWTGVNTLGTIATGTLSESVTGLELSASRYLLGGAAALSLTSGYEIPLTASTTNWNGFYNTPSTRITDGDALTWSSNTLNFDGGASPGGELGGTWASPSIDSGAVTLDEVGNPGASKTFSMSNKNLVFNFTTPTGADGAFEIEATGAFTGDLVHVHQLTGNPGATDLLHLEAADPDVQMMRVTSAGGYAITTMGGSVGFGTTTPSRLLTVQGGDFWLGGNFIATGTASFTYGSSTAISGTNVNFTNGVVTNATSSYLSVNTGIDLFGGGIKTTANALCIQLTGSSALCDGSDDGGGSGELSDWQLGGTGYIVPTTTVGIVVQSSSTISDLSMTNATATNLIVPTSINIFGGGQKTTANALCIQLTGSADLCDGADAGGTGSGGSNWSFDGTRLTPTTTTAGILVNGSSTVSYLNFTNATGTKLTFGSAVPWSMGFSSTDNSFSIASSSVLGSNYFIHAFSTTTILESLVTGTTDYDVDQGVRMNFGGSDYDGSANLDHFTFHGRVKNDDWFNWSCPYASSQHTQVTSDTSTAAGLHGMCPGFDFWEDGTSYLDTYNSSTGYNYSQLGSITAQDGAGFFALGNTVGWLRFASTTPSFEVSARIGSIVANSTTTQYAIGFANVNPAGTSYETSVPPTAGCYFVASSTQANWRAICRSNTSLTNVDTGVSSTTVGTGNGAWRTFRIDGDKDEARFYIKQPGGGPVLVANIVDTSVPTTSSMNVGIWFGRTSGTQEIQFQFFGVDLWWRKFLPNGT